MNQKIIEKTLAMNLFEESKKSSNWFVSIPLNIPKSYCFFTEDIPFHYFQYVCLWLTYSNYWLDRIDYCDEVNSKDNIVGNYNREQKLDNFAILNCKQDNVCGAFSRFWLKTKVGKNLNVCYNQRTINMLTKFPDDIEQRFSFSMTTFNKKLNKFGNPKTKYKTLPILNNQQTQLLSDFSKLFLVKK